MFGFCLFQIATTFDISGTQVEKLSVTLPDDGAQEPLPPPDAAGLLPPDELHAASSSPAVPTTIAVVMRRRRARPVTVPVATVRTPLSRQAGWVPAEVVPHGGACSDKSQQDVATMRTRYCTRRQLSAIVCRNLLTFVALRSTVTAVREEVRVLAKQRQALILDEIRRTGGVRVRELTSKLGVSDMTIRRDLHRLEQ